MATTVEVRRDGRGDPRVSATFVLSRVPAPDDRLGPLVERGMISLDVVVGDGDPLLTSVTARLVRSSGDPSTATVLAEQASNDPFGHVAITANVEGEDARLLLESVLGGPSGIQLVTEMQPATPAVATVSTQIRARVRLAAMWRVLDAVADDERTFHEVDLVNYLPVLEREGAVVIEAGRDASPHRIVDAVTKAAQWILEPVTDESASTSTLGPAWVLTSQEPAAMEMTGTSTASTGQQPATGGAAQTATVSLDQLVAPAIRHDPQRFVHLVGVSGGELDVVLPVRSRARAGRPNRFHLATATNVGSLTAALRPTATEVVHPAITSQLVATLHRPELVHLAALELVVDRPERRPGPIVADTAATFWPDRWNDSVAWYSPRLTLRVPDPAQPVEASPFSFVVRPGVGHTADGRPSIEATVTITLARDTGDDTVRDSDAAGRSERRAVEPTATSYQLAIPFRDERGENRVELVTAESVTDDADSSTLTFRLADNWARLAYGALSTPDFQTEPARVIVTSTFEGWRAQRNKLQIAGLHKRRALTGFESTSIGDQPGTTLTRTARPVAAVALHSTALMTAHVEPAWAIRPEWLDRLERVDYAWSKFAATREIDVLVPCAAHGATYQESIDGELRAIGCRPALQLGEIEYRTYEPLTLSAAAGQATVFRSLRSPGRFLVMPTRYVVGRYEPGSEREYAPTLLLHSTIDIDDATNIRCVLAASLQPDLPRFRREAIIAELRASAHPDPVLEYLPDAGVAPEVLIAAPGDADVDCVATSTGFDVVCSTDIPGFLTLRALLERGGLRGSVQLSLPGGVMARSDLVMASTAVAGPFEAGPLTMRPDRGSVVIGNPTGQRIAVTGLAVDGVQVSSDAVIVPPDGSVTIAAPATDGDLVPIYTVDGGAERLEELRAYVEDLELGVVFVATVDPDDHGLTGLEIETRFLDQVDDPLILTSRDREAERTYRLPLTEFIDDPVVEFTVHAVSPDGSRRSSPPTTWAIRSQGALIPVGPPP